MLEKSISSTAGVYTPGGSDPRQSTSCSHPKITLEGLKKSWKNHEELMKILAINNRNYGFNTLACASLSFLIVAARRP